MNVVISALLNFLLLVITACTRLSKISSKIKSTNRGNKDADDWYLTVLYPEEVKLITQSKEVDVHALIGNIGGYIGLFLGN